MIAVRLNMVMTIQPARDGVPRPQPTSGASEWRQYMANTFRLPLAVCAAVVLGAAAAAAQGTHRGSQQQIPPAVKQAIDANKPGAEIDKLEVEKEAGITLYDIEFKAGKGEIEIAEDGTVLDVTDIVDEKELPGLPAACFLSGRLIETPKYSLAAM